MEYHWQDEILVEDFDSILTCLGHKGKKVFDVERTEKGFRFSECCDGYYGITLTNEQVLKLSRELELLASELPHGSK